MRLRIAVTLCLAICALPAWAGTLKDDFEDGDMRGWTQETPQGWATGKLHIENGELVYESSLAPTGMSIGQTTWKDYEIEVDIKITEHELDLEGTEGAAIFARRSEKGMYIFVFGSILEFKCVVALYVEGDNQFYDIDKSAVQPWNWDLNKWYHLKLAASGSKFSFYVDGQLALEYNNGDFDTGRPGIGGVWKKTNARLDNVVITGDEVPDAGPSGFAVEPAGKLAATWATIKEY